MEPKNIKAKKTFDAIEPMREITDKISLEIINMTYEQERSYLDRLLSKGKKAQSKAND